MNDLEAAEILESMPAQYGTRQHEAKLHAAKRLREVQWQPIETAPRDGTWIVLWEAMEETPSTFQWNRGRWLSPDGVVWHNEDLYAPTHWMPLPEPPK